MNQEHKALLNASCIQLNVEATDWQDAIRKACIPLIDNGFVTKDYPNDVIEREKQWATGLPTMPVGVAIPHALKPDNVIEAQVAACRLNTPVMFTQSGGTEDDDPVAAHIVFVLALKDAKAQLGLLQTLMIAISDEELLNQLIHATTPEEFSNIFNESTNNS